MISTYFLAYVISVVGGAVGVGILLRMIHLSLGFKKRSVWLPLHLWVGSCERIIATTLFIWTPKQLPIFIGGWVAAEFAAGWGRRKGEDASDGHFISLVGNAVSFAIAIAAGFWAHPASLQILNSSQ